jgi:predicted murein hydrolase (TIGR00659 family)
MNAEAYSVLSALFWLATTITAYLATRTFYRRTGYWWASPLLLAPILLLALALLLRVDYTTYFAGPRWLVTMLGPTTVAFAIPIYRQRDLIRRHWKTLAVGTVTGSSVAIVSAFLLAHWLALSPELTLSLLPRSVTTPFAMDISARIGGRPELTAVFVIITGLSGATFGPMLFRVLPLRSAMSRGALLGMAAHGTGVAKAREIGDEEAAIAGLTMVLAGVLNVLVAPPVILALAG